MCPQIERGSITLAIPSVALRLAATIGVKVTLNEYAFAKAMWEFSSHFSMDFLISISEDSVVLRVSERVCKIVVLCLFFFIRSSPSSASSDAASDGPFEDTWRAGDCKTDRDIDCDVDAAAMQWSQSSLSSVHRHNHRHCIHSFFIIIHCLKCIVDLPFLGVMLDEACAEVLVSGGVHLISVFVNVNLAWMLLEAGDVMCSMSALEDGIGCL